MSEVVRLGDVCVLNPKTPTIDESLVVSFVPMQNVGENGEFDSSESRACGEVRKGFTYFENGDVLFAKITPCMENGKGAVAKNLINGIGFGSTEFHVLRPNNEIIRNEWLYYLLSWECFRKDAETNMTGSAGQKRVPKKFLENYCIKIPSIFVQDQNVAVLKKVSELIYVKKQQLSKLDELVKSRFIEMFGEPLTNSKGWKTECLFSVAPTKQIPFELSGKVWLLNLDAVESNTGTVLFKNIVSNNEVNASTVMFSTDNVLYSKLRPYLNKVVLPDDKGVATSELLPLYPDKTKLNRVYLCYWLRNDAFVKHISEKVAGAKMPRVSMDYFRSIDIELPPIDLQNQFAEFVEQTDKSKLEIKESLEKLETLKKSLMQKYFG